MAVKWWLGCCVVISLTYWKLRAQFLILQFKCFKSELSFTIDIICYIIVHCTQRLVYFVLQQLLLCLTLTDSKLSLAHVELLHSHVTSLYNIRGLLIIVMYPY